MSCFKFVQIEITSKDFYKQKHVTDIFMINVNTVVVSDKVSCNNGKEWWYIAGVYVDGKTIISLFPKTPKKIFSYGMLQCDKNSAYAMLFIVSEVPEWGWVAPTWKADNKAYKSRR